MKSNNGLTLEKVLDVAVGIADKNGLDNLTLGQVAAELGVKTPSLYEYVDGVAGLRWAIRLHGFQIMGYLISKASVGKSRDEAVRSIAFELRRFVHHQPALYESTVLTAEGDSKEIRKAAAEVLTTLNSVLVGYGIVGKEAIHAARYLRSLLHGFNSLELTHGFGFNANLDESYDGLVGTLAQDLREWNVRSKHPDTEANSTRDARKRRVV